MSVSNRRQSSRSKCQSANENLEEVSSTTIILSSDQTDGMESITICSNQIVNNSTDNVILITTAAAASSSSSSSSSVTSASSPSTIITVPITELKSNLKSNNSNNNIDHNNVLNICKKSSAKSKPEIKCESISTTNITDKPGTSKMVSVGE